jgi:protease IV
MKQFFGAFFGSIVGIIITALLFILIAAIVIQSAMGSLRQKDESAILKDNTVLRLDLKGEITDREKENPLKDIAGAAPFLQSDGQGLNMLLRRLSRAKDDSKVKGLYITFHDMKAGYATLRELRDAVAAFRKAGKFVYCYSDDFSQKEYYLASAADRIFLNPEGFFEWKGLHMNLTFLKGTIEKLDLEMQIFRHGRFKSAVEPFTMKSMSDENRYQSEIFLNSIWNTLLDDISKARKIDKATLNAMADSLSLRFPEDALGKMIEVTGYEDEAFAEIKKKIGLAEKDKLKFVEIDKYSARPITAIKAGADKIAIIYATGGINTGEGDDDEVGSDRLVRAIREARLDDKVKGIVLRVNSPGGSAIASEVIWREMTLAGKKKPVAVSMGDVAASGGYYIACGAHRIFAQPNTITGSIGVFGVIPNAKKLFENKLGITFDTVNTNKYSDAGTGLRALTAREGEYVQGLIERIYATFTKRVAEGRRIPQNEVDSIGQGRVWSGADALKINLVDEMGGVDDAVKWVAKKAAVKEFRLTELPKQKSPFDAILGSKEEVSTYLLKHELGETYSFLKQAKDILNMKGVQARMVFDIQIE